MYDSLNNENKHDCNGLIKNAAKLSKGTACM